jgi:two-component system, NtrC family, response regulator PilR
MRRIGTGNPDHRQTDQLHDDYEKNTTILVVDDERSMRELLEYMLSKEGYTIALAENGRKALERIEAADYDLVLTDIKLGDLTGLDVLRAAKAKNPATVVIMISAYATTETAVEAMNDGAYDYVPKPFDNDELKLAIATALERKTLAVDRQVIEDELKNTVHFGASWAAARACSTSTRWCARWPKPAPIY